MTICVTCGEYYRLNTWHNNKLECQNCVDILPNSYVDEDYEVEKTTLLNPTGKTQPVFYEADSYEYRLE